MDTTEMSLRQRLSELGWPDRFLGAHGYYARLGSRGGHTRFVPFGRFARWFTARSLSIEEIVPLGSKVKFLKSLKYDIAGQSPFPSFSWLVDRVMSHLAGEDLTKMALFKGFIVDDPYYKNKPFPQFPFDEYLLVRSVERFDSLYEEADGTWWRIDHKALTTVTQIEVEIESTPLQSTDEARRVAVSRAEAQRIREARRSLGYDK